MMSLKNPIIVLGSSGARLLWEGESGIGRTAGRAETGNGSAAWLHPALGRRPLRRGNAPRRREEGPRLEDALIAVLDDDPDGKQATDGHQADDEGREERRRAIGRVSCVFSSDAHDWGSELGWASPARQMVGSGGDGWR